VHEIFLKIKQQSFKKIKIKTKNKLNKKIGWARWPIYALEP
jgi:hypothetical protein